ncbi:MAG: iron-containing alcohol dehydrogenase [Syntrophorhabdales bacterium]|jgi:alcohol dehydrogenase
MYSCDPERIYSFLAPSRHLVGKDSISQVGAEVKALGGRKALIVTDPGVIKAGLHSAVIEPLEKNGVEARVYDGVEAEPPARVVDDAVTEARAGQYDIIIGIGGGSSLDAAKGVAIMCGNEGQILDYAGLNICGRSKAHTRAK